MARHKLEWFSFVLCQPRVAKASNACIDIERRKNRLLKYCYVPATSAAHNRLLFFLFLLRPFTVLMKQTRQAVRTVKQSLFLDVYECMILLTVSLINFANGDKVSEMATRKRLTTSTM